MATRLPAIDVAAAIIEDQAGRILLAERKANQLSPGCWEIPGGKIERGETPSQAAARELAEEVGVRAGDLRPWASYEHAFPTRRINLRFFRAQTWDGTPHGREGQRVAWVDPAQPAVGPLLPSHERVLKALSLPRRIAMADGTTSGCQATMLAGIDTALRAGTRLIILRAPPLPLDQRIAFARRAQSLAAAHRARLVLEGSALEAQRAGVAGAISDAIALPRLYARPSLPLWGAFCRGADDMQQAISLGADFALLDWRTLGWDSFRVVANQAPMPVYAFGAAMDAAASAASRAGAYGIAVSLQEARHQEGSGGAA
jgi:8-oxo-dGTP diphosphatase